MSSVTTTSTLFVFLITLVLTSLQLQRSATLLEPKVRNAHLERICPGTCMSQSNCAYFEGIGKGHCIDGTVCCQFERSCEQTSKQLVSYFQSPNYPLHTNASLSCTLQVHILPQISALRIDFDIFEMLTPKHYPGGIQKCIEDNFYILNGKNGPNEGLCAMANYTSILYVKESSNLTLLFVMQSQHWRWRIKLTQLNSSRVPIWKNSPDCGRQLMYEDTVTNQATLLNSPTYSVTQRFIVNGEEAGGSEFPWQVSIQVTPKHRCGGSIINERFILTAAHCFAEAAYIGEFDKLRVVIGTLELNSTALDTIQVRNVIMNYEYKPFDEHVNDIALLYLSRDIVFSSYTQPICLPSKDILTDNVEGFVSGWGRLNGSTGGGKPNHLQKLQVRLLSNKECHDITTKVVRKMLKTNRTDIDFDIYSSQVCALAPENSTVCFGDSGGPLVIQNQDDGTFAQVGIVSFGLGACVVHPSSPVVYTRVTSFLDFISLVVMSFKE